jgi:hypothetical protein
MSGCGVTATLYGNKVAGAVEELYSRGPEAAKDTLPTLAGGGCKEQAGGCGCLLGSAPQAKRKTRRPARWSLRGGYPGCTGQPTMLRALGIMAGGKRSKRQSAGACGACAGLPRFLRGGSRRSTGGKYIPTARNKALLRKWRAGKSIGFTARSSLKAKGLIPRANGTFRLSAKYK